MVVTLPDAPFRHREGMGALIAALGADHARYVGGIVRDTLLGIDAADAKRLERLHAISEFKRYQATIIPKLSPRSFGRGRELPVGG